MMRRIRVGLTGLACVFLLVMLATALISMGGERNGGNLTAAAPNEPLAQLGVVPGNPAGEGTASPAAAPKTPKHN